MTVVTINRELLDLVVSDLRDYHADCDLCGGNRACPTQQHIERAAGLISRAAPVAAESRHDHVEVVVGEPLPARPGAVVLNVHYGTGHRDVVDGQHQGNAPRLVAGRHI